jgi:tetratricopeptide (TPR) repeat protein
MTSSTPAGAPKPISGVDGTDDNANNANNGANPNHDEVEVNTALQAADAALASRDGKAAISALGTALGQSRSDVSLERIVAKLEVLAEAGTESDAVVGLLGRATERAGDALLETRILRARARLHVRSGHLEAALQVQQRLLRLLVDPGERGAVAEEMGDLALSLGLAQQALIHLQAAFRADRTRTSATRKAIAIYFDTGREEQAKQLLDVLTTQQGTLTVEAQRELADGYVRAAEALLVRPQAHGVVRDALDRVTRLAPDLARGRTLRAELEAFPQAWKDHVRRLRDAALDARDKRDAARRYLAIAQIYAAYAPGDGQIEQNVEKCLLLAPGYRPAIKFLEQIYRADGRLNELIERIKKLAEGVRATDVAVDLWLFVAVLLAERGASPDELAGAYDKVRLVDPRNVAAIHALTELHLEHGRYDKAVVVMEAFVRESGDADAKAQTLRQLARLYEVELQDLPKACERLEQMLELVDGDSEDDVLRHLIDLYERMDGAEAAEKLAGVLEQRARHLRRRSDVVDESQVLDRLFALYHGQLAQPEKAFTVGRRLFALQPRAPLEAELSRLAEALGRGADLAAALTDAAARLGGTGEARRMRLRAAEVFLSVGDRKRARHIVDQLLESDPRDAGATALIDSLLAKDAAPEEHAAILESRLRLQSEPVERSRTLTALADTYARMRRFDDAVAAFGSALDADGTNRAALDKLEALLRGQERFAELASCLERRVRVESDVGDVVTADAARQRLVRVYEERLDRGADAAELALRLLDGLAADVAIDDPRRTELVRSLERLLERGVASVAIAEALQPHFAQVGNWRRQAEMLSIRRGAESQTDRRLTLAKALVQVFEERLKSPREAFDVACEVLLEEPASVTAFDELARLADAASAHARFADTIGTAAARLPDGSQKSTLLARRASLLQGVLGDQVAAIEAHQSILRDQPGNLESLDALIDLLEARESWGDLRPVLQQRLAVTSGDDVSALAAKLGLLLVHRFGDGDPRPLLERALVGTRPVAGEMRVEVLTQLAALLRKSVVTVPADAAALADTLSSLAGELAGKQRSAVRAELGDVLRVHQRRFRDALGAYDAAIANDAENAAAWDGVRGVLDAEDASVPDRQAAGRTLLARAEHTSNAVQHAGVLQTLYRIEPGLQARRALVAQLAGILVEDLDAADDALDMLLKHLESDPGDEPVRRQAEAVASGLARADDLFAIYRRLRASEDRAVASLYSERLAAMTAGRGDIDGALEALQFQAALDPTNAVPWRQMIDLLERKNDALGVATALSHIADIAPAAEKVERLLELADYCAEVLEDDQRGLAAIRTAHALAPGDDAILARLEGRLRLARVEGAELADVLFKRAALQTTASPRAALLAEHGAITARLGDASTAVASLLSSLRVERDGQSTLRVTELLQKIAVRDDDAGLAALDAIIEHHREQKAWQPLVESLEIAAQKRAASDDRARLFDEISDLNERALRVPQLAFMATCRALRDAPTESRLSRARALAEATDSFGDLLEVCEDVAEAFGRQPDGRPTALRFLQEAAAVAGVLGDNAASIQVAEATLRLDPASTEALGVLERIHRADADQAGLLEVLQRRAEQAGDASTRRGALLEMAKLTAGANDATAEAALGRVLELDGLDIDALRLLDELYERTGNSAAHVAVLERRIGIEQDQQARSRLRSKLGVLRLRRRGDPGGALDDLTAAVSEGAAVAEVRSGLEVLLEHARSRGAPPVAVVAELLERSLRAQNDLGSIPPVLELRLLGATDHGDRAALLAEVAAVQEKLGQPGLAFMAICRAIKELPEDASLRGEAERLAVATESLETLALVYEDVLDAVTDPATRVLLHKRIATLAETVGGDNETARERLVAAVQAGANDTDTLKDLVRLTRETGRAQELSGVLLRLAEAAVLEANIDAARDAYAELADVDENLGNLAGAIHACRELMSIDSNDRAVRSTLERLYGRAERWLDLVELLTDSARRGQTPEEQANVLARLVHVQLEKLRDVPGALTSMQALAHVLPTSEAIVTLGSRALIGLTGDQRPEARQWRAALAVIVEPRYEAQGAWAELAPVLRLRFEVEASPEERKRLWLRVIDIEERLLNKPELAMLSLSRALTEDPGDTSLRERAERLSVRLHDLESLLGLYEDLIVRLTPMDPLRIVYANRCAELYEGGVGDPTRAAEMYEQAWTATVAQGRPPEDRLKLLERVERLYRAVGDPPRLATTLKRRSELLSGSAPAAARQQLFEAATIEMHGLQDYGAAITTLRKLLELAQGDLPALRALEEACERQQRWPDLAETLERELATIGETDPTRSLEARFKLGAILDSHLGLPDEALIQFQAILAVRPEHKETREYLETRMVARATGRFDGATFLQQSYEKTGDWQKAVEVLQGQVPELERRGDKREIRLHLTRIADIQENELKASDLAFVTLCRALKHDPGDHALRDRLRKVSIAGEIVDELIEVLDDEALAAEVSGKGNLAAELREESASLHVHALGDFQQAIAGYEAVLEKNPGRLVPLEALSTLYAQVARYADLEKALRRRLMFKDDPLDRVQLLVDLAKVLADKLDRPDDAIVPLEEVRRIDPSNIAARRLLIAVLDGQGSLIPLRVLLEEEVASCRINLDADGLAIGRRRLATLLADQLDDTAAAIPLWEEERAAQATTTSTDVSFATLERLYSKAEAWNQLRNLYEEALKVERDPVQLSSLTGKIGDVLSVHLGGKEEAITRHLRVLELDPQNQQSLDALRSLYPALDRHEELVALLRRMMRVTGEAKRLKELRFQLAETLGAKLGKRAEAVETGRRILDIEPHTNAELERLAGVFRACEAWEELADVLERFASQLEGPTRVLRLLEIADVFEQNLGRGRLASSAYEKILAIEPRHERAYARLCAIHADNADWQRLIALKEERVKAISAVPTRIELLREIGALYDEKLGQKPLAFLAACRAYREDYDNADLAGWMDKLALETDSVDELVTIYDDALESLSREPRILATHLRMAELAWKHLGSPNDAEIHFKRVLEYDARSSAALEGLAALYESLERPKDVVAIYERRVEQAVDVPGRIDWLRKIAKVLDQKARDVDGAISAYKRITELDGTNAVALKELAELLEREMRWPNLITTLKRSEELAPTTEDRLAIRYRIAGIWEQQLENPDQAIAVYRTVLDEDGGHLLALKAMERLFTSLNRPEELLKVFERMVQLAPTAEEAVRLLGKIAATYEESFEDLRSAANAHERVLQVDPQNVPAVKQLERLLRALQEWELLVQAYELHIRLTRDPKEIVTLYLAMGEVQARELGRTDKAEAVYNAALDFDPSSQDAIHALGSLYEKSGNWFNALEKLQQEAQLKGASPEAVDTYYRIGKINEDMLLDQGNAVIAYRAALHIEPSHVPSIQALRDIASARHEHQERLKWLRAEAQYTKDEAERTAVHTATGVFLQDTLSDLEGASDEFEKALAISYDHLPAARPLADISFRDEHWNRAEQLLDIIVERLDPNTEGAELCRQHYRLGYVCEKLQKDQKALKNYQRAYEIDSTYLPALEGLGASLSRAGRWDDASKIYQAILIHHRDGLTDAEIVDYYQQLADLNQKLVQSDRAIKNLEKALELDPNHAPSLRLLATVYEGEQRFEEAYEAMMRLISQVSGDERVALLVEIGRLAKSELDDPYRAIDAYEDANRQRPGDRDILQALLQLYRHTRQGPRAVEILEELVRIEPDEKARVRLNQTLGEVWRDELKNDARAVQYFNAALDLDPTFVKAFESIESALSSTSNWAGLEENYIAMLKRLPQADPRGIKGVLWKNLGDLYRFKLKNLEGATQAYMVLAKMTPNDTALLEVLADLLSKNPAAVDDAILTWQRLVQLNPDGMTRPLHELVRLYLAKKLVDRAYLACTVLNAVKDASPQEQQLLTAYQKQAPAQAKRAMTDKLWDLLLVHPDARGPLAQLSTMLWRSAGSSLMRQPKDYGFDKKKVWEKQELDAPVPMYFVTQLKYVRGVLNVGAFELWEKLDGGEALGPLALEVPTLAIGKGNPMLRDTNARALWFQISRQVSGLRPAFVLPRTLGAQRFNALIDVTIKLVEPRYPIKADPREVQDVERALAKIAGPLANAARPIVAELLKARQAVNTKAFLEGMEHTALRTGYLMTGDIELALTTAKQADAAIPLSYAAKAKELLTFAASEEHFELRQRLGTAIG